MLDALAQKVLPIFVISFSKAIWRVSKVWICRARNKKAIWSQLLMLALLHPSIKPIDKAQPRLIHMSWKSWCTKRSKTEEYHCKRNITKRILNPSPNPTPHPFLQTEASNPGFQAWNGFGSSWKITRKPLNVGCLWLWSCHRLWKCLPPRPGKKGKDSRLIWKKIFLFGIRTLKLCHNSKATSENKDQCIK